MKKRRPVALTPEERVFRFDDWVTRTLTVVEKHGPEWLCICPRCSHEKLALHVGKKAFRCLWAGCGVSGWSPIRLVAITLRIRWEDAQVIVAAASLGHAIGPVSALEKPESITSGYTTRPLPQGTLPPIEWRLLPAQRAYIQHRGVADAYARAFGLATVLPDGSGSKADRALAGRVLFPIWQGGRVVFWVGRDISGRSKAKTINMPRPCREAHGPWCACYHEEWGLPATPGAAWGHEVVLGLHLVRRGHPVYVVEGGMDAAVCGPQFVATLGAKCDPTQAALIAASGASEAIVLYDGDEGGAKGAPKAAEVLSAALPTRFITCPRGEDPGSLGRERSMSIAHSALTPGQQVGLNRQPITVPKTKMNPPFVTGLEKR